MMEIQNGFSGIYQVRTLCYSRFELSLHYTEFTVLYTERTVSYNK
jgi:hypothetical protein